MDCSKENKQQFETMRKNLTALRLAHQWSVEELAKTSKIPVKALTAVENGGDIRLDHLWTLCRIYRIPLRAIFTEQPLPEENS